MKWWPFSRKLETRESGGDFTDAVVRLLESQAAGSAADASSTAATEAAAGALSRAFASAEVQGPGWARDAVTPDFLALTGRNLIRAGDSMHLIEVDHAGRAVLLPCSSWHFEGHADPATWTVRATVYGPSTSMTRHVPYAGVVYAQWGAKPGQPYVGIGPTSWAHQTARLQSETERSMADEAGAPVGSITVVPSQVGRAGEDGSETNPTAKVQEDIGKARGKSLVLEALKPATGEKGGGKEWQFERFGPMPPESMEKIRAGAFNSMLSACGCPPSLFLDADGTGQREAVRRWHQNTVLPLARILEHELREKLEVDISLKFDNYPLDLQGRAQAFQKLVAGGMTPEKALQVSGLLAGEEAA